MNTATILHNLTTATAGTAKAPPSLGSSAMMAAGIALLSLWLLIRLRRRGRQIAERSETRRESLLTQDTRPHPRADDLDAAMVRMQELTRECAAQIDNRIERLEHVLRLADERIREMETRAAQSPHAVAPLAFTAPTPSGGHELNLRRPPAEAPAPAPTSTLDPLTRRVHELADRGRGPIEIAQQLNEPTGKIELILALRHASAV